ncbi:MAG: tripartite tricarboxylate transporter substrate-binding protein [Pseudomonadota bacterium]|nr:tripartite tricarboxylate transporter substrate-binding protein [Pseudomonadota bacterium]
MHKYTKTLVAGLVAGAVAAGAATSASAAMDYAGKTIKIVIPYGPGGTYDKYGVSFSNHLGKHIPGNPNIILQHMPGAGGAKAMNWFYNVAPKDGSTLIVPLDNGVTNQLMRPKKMRYDARNFTWLGSSNQTNVVMVVRTDTGVTKLDDLKSKQIIGSTSGKNSSGYLNPMLLRGLFGYKIKMVTGYKGSSKSIFAMEQGESQMAAFNWLAWASKVPHWFTGDKPFARAIAQIGIFRDPDLPKSVPMVNELVSDPLDKKAVGFLSVAGLLGRGLALPPGVDKGTIKVLRAAYDKMNADPAFAAELKKRKLRLIPSTGAAIQKVVNDSVTNASPEVVTHARKLIFGG